jgi:hypothetical protein
MSMALLARQQDGIGFEKAWCRVWWLAHHQLVISPCGQSINRIAPKLFFVRSLDRGVRPPKATGRVITCTKCATLTDTPQMPFNKLNKTIDLKTFQNAYLSSISENRNFYRPHRDRNLNEINWNRGLCGLLSANNSFSQPAKSDFEGNSTKQEKSTLIEICSASQL